MNIENIPQELRDSAQWCVWRYEMRNGTDSTKRTKIPYNPLTGEKASSNDPFTFASFTDAFTALEAGGYDGLGIGIFGDIGAIDIDHCVEGGELSEQAKDIVERMDSYTETSPSGAGIRIIFRAPGFQYDKAKYYVNNQQAGIEVYIAGVTCKYVTITGNALHSVPIAERTDAIIPILDKYMRKAKGKKASEPKKRASRIEVSIVNAD